MKKSLVVVVAVVSAIGLAGCQSYGKNRPRPADDSAPGYGARAGQAVDDAALTGKVKAALAADAGLSTLTFNVDSKQGAVTIYGTVKSQDQSDKVTKVATTVEGVKSVENKLVIRPE